MEQTPLSAQVRPVLGRKVKTLRKAGMIPGHVFGNKVEPVSVQVKGMDFLRVFGKVGETGIISLEIDGQKRPVLVKDTQKHPATDDLMHIDFYQVNLSEKVKVNVPVEIVGESPAVEKKVGLLLTPISEIEIEALPADLPENIEVDVSTLANIGDQIKIQDLKIDRSKIEILADPEQIVADIGELVTKEMEELEAQVEAEQAEAEAAEGAEAATAEGTEGEQPVEGEEKPQEQAEEKPQE